MVTADLDNPVFRIFEKKFHYHKIYVPLTRQRLFNF